MATRNPPITAFTSRHRFLTWFALGVSLSACSSEQAPIAGFDETGWAVTGGELAPEAEGVFRIITGRSSCSASLVAPNLVLTAMHCVAPIAVNSSFECLYNGDINMTTENGGALGAVVAANTVEIFDGVYPDSDKAVAKGKKIFTTNSNHICIGDLALIQLDTELDSPLLKLRLDSDVAKGEDTTVVGYGTTGVAGDPIARRTRSAVKVDAVGGEAGTTVVSAAPPRTFTVGRGPCPGDSGGPAIGEKRGGSILGVYSIGYGDCATEGALNIYTRLAPYRNFILTAFESAGFDPWFEGEDAPGIPDPPPAPSASAATPPVTGDAGAMDSGDEDDDEDPVNPRRRLSSGCALSASHAPSSSAWLLLPALVWLSRRTRSPQRDA